MGGVNRRRSEHIGASAMRNHIFTMHYSKKQSHITAEVFEDLSHRMRPLQY